MVEGFNAWSLNYVELKLRDSDGYGLLAGRHGKMVLILGRPPKRQECSVNGLGFRV